MKPTQEQVIAWAREAGFGNEVWSYADSFIRLSELAYEAGRKDENEACWNAIEEVDDGEAPEYRICQEAISARREQC